MYIGTKGKIKPMKMVFYFQGSRCFGSCWGFYDKGNNKLIKFKKMHLLRPTPVKQI